MENKKFLQICDNVLKEYGFEKIKKLYYLDLPDIIIEFRITKDRFNSFNYIFEFTFSVKAFNSNPSKINFERSDAHCLILNVLISEPNAFEKKGIDRDGFIKEVHVRGIWAFTPEKLEELEWKVKFDEMIHRYFDPFKKDAFQAIRAANKERNRNLFFSLKKEIAEYIGVENW